MALRLLGPVGQGSRSLGVDRDCVQGWGRTPRQAVRLGHAADPDVPALGAHSARATRWAFIIFLVTEQRVS